MNNERHFGLAHRSSSNSSLFDPTRRGKRFISLLFVAKRTKVDRSVPPRTSPAWRVRGATSERLARCRRRPPAVRFGSRGFAFFFLFSVHPLARRPLCRPPARRPSVRGVLLGDRRMRSPFFRDRRRRRAGGFVDSVGFLSFEGCFPVIFVSFRLFSSILGSKGISFEVWPDRKSVV